MEEMKLSPFTENDIPGLAPIMKRAFDRDSQIHLNESEGGPTGYDNGSFLRKYALDPSSTAFAVTAAGKPAGAVILWLDSKKARGTLGCLFLDPDCQDSGIGARLWKKIESLFPEIREWRTETPGFSRRNHHFYVNKCGFRIYKINNPKDPRESSFLMRKTISPKPQ